MWNLVEKHENRIARCIKDEEEIKKWKLELIERSKKACEGNVQDKIETLSEIFMVFSAESVYHSILKLRSMSVIMRDVDGYDTEEFTKCLNGDNLTLPTSILKK